MSLPPKKNDYEVGYGKPPINSRFKKGRSGNPTGGRRRSGSPWKTVEEALSRKLTITENGQTKRVTMVEALVKRLIAKGLAGDRLSILKALDLAAHAESVARAESGAAGAADQLSNSDKEILKYLEEEFGKTGS